MRTVRTSSVLAVAVAGCLTVAACGGGDDATSAATDATTTTTASSSASSTTASSTSVEVNANTASADEIAAGLDRCGVSNASRWAREVTEYRPYDTVDADMTHLRQELAKYNPGQATIDAIVACLRV
ncbi:MAG: hypothetical protein V7636_1236 [Actinomycetota bacterium]|jgi:DNA uptake protein ComE-like DNA-binding protein